MALHEKPRVGHTVLSGVVFLQQVFILCSLGGSQCQVLYYHSASSCLHLSSLCSHIDVQRERAQGKRIGKVLIFIVKCLCSVEWHVQYLSANTKQCVSIFGITFINGAHAYCDTEKKCFEDLHSAVQFYNILGCSIFIDDANLVVRFISYVSLGP